MRPSASSCSPIWMNSRSSIRTVQRIPIRTVMPASYPTKIKSTSTTLLAMRITTSGTSLPLRPAAKVLRAFASGATKRRASPGLPLRSAIPLILISSRTKSFTNGGATTPLTKAHPANATPAIAMGPPPSNRAPARPLPPTLAFVITPTCKRAVTITFTA